MSSGVWGVNILHAGVYIHARDDYLNEEAHMWTYLVNTGVCLWDSLAQEEGTLSVATHRSHLGVHNLAWEASTPQQVDHIPYEVNEQEDHALARDEEEEVGNPHVVV